MPTVLIPRRVARNPRRGELFTRQAWDNPIRFPLNRSYGTEFEFRTYSEILRRFKPQGTVSATDFTFPGGSAIEWLPAAQGSWLLQAIPPYDFEAVLEMQMGTDLSGFGQMPSLAVLDANGTGVGFSIYNDGNAYTWAITTWNYAGTGNAVGNGVTADARHIWVALNKTGTAVKGRTSNTGTAWNAYTAASTLGVTPVYLALGRAFSTAAKTLILHRLNVYPGPTFFPG